MFLYLLLPNSYHRKGKQIIFSVRYTVIFTGIPSSYRIIRTICSNVVCVTTITTWFNVVAVRIVYTTLVIGVTIDCLISTVITTSVVVPPVVGSPVLLLFSSAQFKISIYQISGLFGSQSNHCLHHHHHHHVPPSEVPHHQNLG